MDEFTKLIRINFNNKIFDVFSDKNHRKAFLEVRKVNQEEKYYHPQLNDLINLNLIYNVKGNELYEQKYRFTVKTLIGGVIVANIIVYSSILYLNNKVNLSSPKTIIVNDLKEEVEEPKKITIEIKNNTELDELGIRKVTFDEVRETINNNPTFTGKYREYINDFVTKLEERLPKVDLRVFNINMKSMQLNVIDPDNWEYTGADANYILNTNTMNIKSEYSSEIREKEVFFHELSHTLNNSNFKIDKGSIEYLVIKHFDLGNNGYGDSGTEAFNVILTDYLLSKKWYYYFNFENHTYSSYNRITGTYYQILKLLDNYDIYTYLEGNINDLIYELQEYDLEGIIDVLDTNMNTSNNDADIVDNTVFETYKEEVVRHRIEKMVETDMSDRKIIDTLKVINITDKNNYKICSDIINKNDIIPFKTEILLDPIQDEMISSYVDMNGEKQEICYSYNNAVTAVLTSDKEDLIMNINNIFVYKDENDTFQLGYISNDLRQGEKWYNYPHRNEISRSTNIFPLKTLLNKMVYLPEYDENGRVYYKVTFNSNMLEERLVLNYLNDYFGAFTNKK